MRGLAVECARWKLARNSPRAASWEFSNRARAAHWLAFVVRISARGTRIARAEAAHEVGARVVRSTQRLRDSARGWCGARDRYFAAAGVDDDVKQSSHCCVSARACATDSGPV